MKSNRVHRRKLSEWITAYSFLIPNIVGLTVFIFIPIIYSFYVSLHEWNALGSKIFIGFDNYSQLASDIEWWKSVLRTIMFTVIYVPLHFALALFFAVILNNVKGRIAKFTRTLYLMPFAISSVVSAIIAIFLLDPRYGFVNQILSLLGISNQPFLGSTSQAMMSILIVVLWVHMGYNMTIFFSAIKEIPRDYYEAAEIDGATKWQEFRNITFPLLRETSTFILVVTTITSFQVLDQILVMTNGGPANATEVSVIYIYKQAFEFLNMGYASALSVVLFLIIFVFSIIQLRLYSVKN